jgi:AcrR family transcriptional regulator
MEDIAAAAGIAVGTLYNYFEDRRALIAAVLEVRTRALIDALDQALSPESERTSRGPGRFAAELERFADALTVPRAPTMRSWKRTWSRLPHGSAASSRV